MKHRLAMSQKVVSFPEPRQFGRIPESLFGFTRYILSSCWNDEAVVETISRYTKSF